MHNEAPNEKAPAGSLRRGPRLLKSGYIGGMAKNIVSPE